jgi:sugar (pentulose or hexulose) kinase
VTREAVVGIDLGTTMSKALLRTPTGEQVALVEAATPWTTTPDGGTETTAESFVALAIELLRRGYEQASAEGPIRVSAVAVAGLAESGVLLDASGRPQTPVVAWFDRRGSRQVSEISLRGTGFRAHFVRRTGLPWDCQASVAKLLWFVDGGLDLTSASRWLSVPEYVVFALGGELVHEPSLASRTGLLDQARVSGRCDMPGCPGRCRVPRSSSVATTIRSRPSESERPAPANCSTRPEQRTSSYGHCPDQSAMSRGNSLSGKVSRLACTCSQKRAH